MTHTLTDTEIQELIEMEKAATEKPWEGDEYEIVAPKAPTIFFGGIKLVLAHDYNMREQDAEFIIALRNAAPSLLREIVRLRRVVAAAKVYSAKKTRTNGMKVVKAYRELAEIERPENE